MKHFMSCLVILAAAVFEISYRTEKRTDRQTNAAENPTPSAITVSVGN